MPVLSLSGPNLFFYLLKKLLIVIPLCCFLVIYSVFKVRALRSRYHHQPPKQVLAEVAAVELIAELVQILLQELWLYAVIQVGQQ